MSPADEATIRWLDATDVDALVAASHLFDEPVERAGAERYLVRPGHHLAVASVHGVPAGFVSVVEIDHPDKGLELLLYELGVDDAFRRRGIGTALTVAATAFAEQLGCRGTWVLTAADNEAALATYRRAGASDPDDAVVLEWGLRPD